MTIVSRTQWGGDPLPTGVGHMKLPAEVSYIHHSADSPQSDEASHMRSIERYHVEVRKYQAIGYSFVVFPSGRVYEGRGWGRVGAHTEGHNSQGHGICFAGNFETQQVTDKALEAARALLVEGVRVGAIRPGAAVLGHRDTKPTACPGKNLYSRLHELSFAPVSLTIEGPKGIDVPEAVAYAPIQFFVLTPSGKGYYIITEDGAVYAFGDAQYFGRVVVKDAA